MLREGVTLWVPEAILEKLRPMWIVVVCAMYIWAVLAYAEPILVVTNSFRIPPYSML